VVASHQCSRTDDTADGDGHELHQRAEAVKEMILPKR
jgi:hypothetical protein